MYLLRRNDAYGAFLSWHSCYDSLWTWTVVVVVEI